MEEYSSEFADPLHGIGFGYDTICNVEDRIDSKHDREILSQDKLEQNIQVQRL